MCEEPPRPGLHEGIRGTLDFYYDPRRPSAGRRGEAHHATLARAASYDCFRELFSGLFKRTSVPHSIGSEGSMLSLDGIPLLGTLA